MLRRNALLIAVVVLCSFAATYGQNLTLTGKLNFSRRGFRATLLANGRVLISGGYSYPSTSTVLLAAAEVYEPASGMFRVSGRMITPRASHDAVLLPNGKVLIVGGSCDPCINTTTVPAPEMYDPASEKFTAVPEPPLPFTCCEEHATVLRSGTVLLSGVVCAEKTCSVTAQIYDPAQNTYSIGGSIPVRLSGYRQVLLNSGNVLIYGGRTPDCDSDGCASAQVYDVTTNSWSALDAAAPETARKVHGKRVDNTYPNRAADGVLQLFNHPGRMASVEADGSCDTSRIVMPSGHVLVVGELPIVLYPATGAVKRLHARVPALYAPTATILADGSALLIGDDNSGRNHTYAELFRE